MNFLAFLEDLCYSYVINENLVYVKHLSGQMAPQFHLKSVWFLPMLIVRIFHYMTKHLVLFLNTASCSICSILWRLLLMILWCIIKSFQWSNSYSRPFFWVLPNPCMFFLDKSESSAAHLCCYSSIKASQYLISFKGRITPPVYIYLAC